MTLQPKVIGLALVLSMSLAGEALAGSQITYDFAGLSGITASVPATPATVPPGVVASNLVRGFGVTPVSANDAIDSSGWLSGGRDDNQYYAFTINPGSTVLNLTSLVYTDRRSADGPQSFEVDYTLPTSLNFMPIGTYTLSDAVNHRPTFNLSGIAELQGLTQAATFYIFGFNTNTDAGTYRLGNGTGAGDTVFPDNLILTADVTSVPEPSAVVLLGTGLSMLASSWSRRRRRG